MLRSLLAFLLVFAFLGIADAWYLAESALTNTALVCNIAGLSGCNTVAQSPYAHILGIPLGVYGVVFYAIIFVFAAVLLVRRSRLAFHSLFWLGLFGLIGSILFVSVQVFLIKALCIYCLGSAAISLVIFMLTTWIWKRYTPVRSLENLVSIPPIPLPPDA